MKKILTFFCFPANKYSTSQYTVHQGFSTSFGSDLILTAQNLCPTSIFQADCIKNSWRIQTILFLFYLIKILSIISFLFHAHEKNLSLHIVYCVHGNTLHLIVLLAFMNCWMLSPHPQGLYSFRSVRMLGCVSHLFLVRLARHNTLTQGLQQTKA